LGSAIDSFSVPRIAGADLELPPESFLACYNQTFILQPGLAALPLMQSDALSRKKQYNRNG
jgi:hypothetical protein